MEGDHKVPGSSRGCRVSTAKGFLFVFMAALLAVGVGIIVHFAGSRDVTCKLDLGSLPKAAWWTPSEVVSECGRLAQDGHPRVCSACPLASQPGITTTVESEPGLESTSKPETESPPINYRLPSALKPVHYDVELKPYIYGNDSSNFQINGSVSINIHVIKNTNNITIHSHWLNVTKSSVSLVSDQPVTPTVTNITVVNTTQFLVFSLDGPLLKGSNVTLSINFTSRLRTDMFGFYSSSYVTDNNETIYLAVTMFEATYARSAFPCFDEPALKATFNITLLRRVDFRRNYTTISNTDTVQTLPRGDGYVADVHARTPLMSTYLLAFVVSDFLHVQNVTSNGVTNIKYRTWARPNLVANVHLAQDWGVRMYNWLEQNFQPPFPIDKFDNVAVPSFKFGAMENWGLATYREDIAYRPGFTTTNCYSWTGLVTAHELTHQWFGNIVSPKWWWWLWLNEGFAMYWEWTVVTQLFPQHREEEQFLVRSKYTAMVAEDAVSDAHAMNNVKLESHAQIEGSFDEITYSKGGSLVRMMSMLMGQPLFIRALNRYLTKHQFGVADPSDLFTALNEEAISENRLINMTDVMDNWVTQNNFPLVHVTRTGSGAIHVMQARYLGSEKEHDKAVNDTTPYGYLWEIPITYTSSTERNFSKSVTFEDRKWLKKTAKEDDLYDSVFPDPADVDSWVYVNTENHYYYVNYDETNWNALIKQLNRDLSVIPAMSRAQLVHDSWYIAEAGKLNHTIPLRLIGYLKNDFDYVPWRALHRFLFVIDGHLERTAIYDAFRKFMVDLTKKSFDHYGVVSTDSEVTVERFQRDRIMKYACYYGNKKCRHKVLKLFKQLMKSDTVNVVHPDLRRTVYCNGVRYGDGENFHVVWRKYSQAALSKNPEVEKERLYLLEALACVREPWRIVRLFQEINNKAIKKDDILKLIKKMASNPYGRDIAWTMLKTSYDMMLTLDEISNKTLSSIISEVTSTFNTQEQYNEVEYFTSTHNVTSHEGVFKAALKTTKQNIDWLNTHYTVLRQWLSDAGYLTQHAALGEGTYI